jgi:hypothetical protein
MTYACVTGCFEMGRPSERMSMRTCFGFTEDPTGYGHYVFKDAFRPDLFNLSAVHLGSLKYQQFGRGLVLEESTSTPGHGAKPGDQSIRGMSAYVSDKPLLEAGDWTDRMLILVFKSAPFPLLKTRYVPHWEESAVVRYIPGTPEVLVIGRK